jgi:hypothetical protein
MKARQIIVTFYVDVEERKAWFLLPKSIADLFEIKAGDVLSVSISAPDGEPLYHGLARLDPQQEVHGARRHDPRQGRNQSDGMSTQGNCARPLKENGTI